MRSSTEIAQDTSKHVHLEMDVVADTLVISIRDEGAGFDPAAVEDPLAPENRLKTSGRGIFYMKTFMDDVRFRRHAERRNGNRFEKEPWRDKREGGEPSMKTNVRESGGVQIVELKGKITIGSGDVQLRETINKLVDSGKKHILVDMNDVTTIDSSGIGELVGCYTSVTNKGGKLKLLHLPPKINDVLTVTQLITVFDVYESEPEALTSFQG